VHRSGRPCVGEGEPLLRLGVEDAPLDQRHHLADLRFDLLNHLPVVNDVVLEGGRRGHEAEQVMSLLGGHLSLGPSEQLLQREVIDDDFDTRSLGPALGVVLVEPLIVGRYEVTPLRDPKRGRRVRAGAGLRRRRRIGLVRA
jgi:hypothetical protein